MTTVRGGPLRLWVGAWGSGPLRCATSGVLSLLRSAHSLNAKGKILRSGVTNDMHSISPCSGCVGEGIRAQVTWSEGLGASHELAEPETSKPQKLSTPKP